jgi:hypothetical protein
MTQFITVNRARLGPPLPAIGTVHAVPDRHGLVKRRLARAWPSEAVRMKRLFFGAIVVSLASSSMEMSAQTGWGMGRWQAMRCGSRISIA